MNTVPDRACRGVLPAPARCDKALRCAALTSLLLLTGAPLARSEPVHQVIVMPAPGTSARAPGAAWRERIEAQLGMKLTLAGTTRTGALILALPQAIDSSALQPELAQLRQDRALLWVELPAPADAKPKARTKAAFGPPGRKLLVRLRDGVAPDWTVLTGRFSELLGLSVDVERAIGDVWVLQLSAPQPAARLIDLAARLQLDPVVQYADPVLRRFAQAAPLPDDPYFVQQWNLTDPTSGIDLPAGWAVQPSGASMTVAVVDTGILPHPDLDGRVLPGYDFISDPESARDGDGRDPNPHDEGDWTAPGDCAGYPAEDSSWHGTFVAGLIAATPNNGIGIAGIDGSAKILPVRALGRCGGSDEDVFEAMLWASGAPVAGVPPNPNPAKVINLSLGGFGACTQAIQQAIDDALAHGAVVVAAAGNESEDVSSFAPANCNGVITVGAHNRAGERTFYSNFGRRVDISAPSGDGGSNDSVISLSNDGTTVPGDAAYKSGVGTSFSAPLVAGTASLMLARNPNLTAGQILSTLQGTSRDFATGSPCRLGNLCGVGMLDAGLAIASTVPGEAAAPPGASAVIEYYDASLDHYFITADPGEIAALDASATFTRTGYLFYAYTDRAAAPPTAQPVCRFYAGADAQIDSHFFTADPGECQFVQQHWAGVWTLESPAAFYVQVPDAAGECPAGTLPVYRFFDNRRDANHRYSVDLSVRRAMVNRSWIPDGPGANGAAFCSPM